MCGVGFSFQKNIKQLLIVLLEIIKYQPLLKSPRDSFRQSHLYLSNIPIPKMAFPPLWISVGSLSLRLKVFLWSRLKAKLVVCQQV